MSSNFVPTAHLFRISQALLPRGPERAYYEYNFDAGYVMQFVREGFCNGCGACCQAQTELETAPTNDRPPDLGNTDWTNRLGEKGVWTVARDNQGFYFATRLHKSRADVPCPAHGSDGKCRIHNVGKPIICQEWPMGPEQAALYPECSYWFKPIRAWVLEPNGHHGAPISLEGIL